MRVYVRITCNVIMMNYILQTEDKEDMKELLYEEVVDVKDDDISLDCKVAPDDKTARMIGVL